MDIDLGGTTSGLGLVCELKALRERPVTLLLGLSSVDIRISDLGLGADDYITKPFSDAELIARDPAWHNAGSDLSLRVLVGQTEAQR